MDNPPNFEGPKEAQDTSTGATVPDSTGDLGVNDNANNNDAVVAMEEETHKASTQIIMEEGREPNEGDLENAPAEMPAAGLALTKDPSVGTVNGTTAATNGMEMLPEPGNPHVPTDGGAMMEGSNSNNNAASPSNIMLDKHAAAMSTNEEGEELEEEEDRLQENSRRPDNEWQPPKKRRRKPEPMKPFNDMLYELLAFRAREGHCRVPLDAKSALGRWVANLRTQKSNQRKGYHSLDLTQERLEVLNSVGFVWDLQQFDSDSRWKRQYEELAAFKAEHGHCNVPQSTPLGKWVKMQRENYRETQLKASGQLPTGRSKPRPTLSQFRIEQLEALGFNWKVAAPAVGWEHRFEELLDYRRVHGDCNVPQAWQENRQLGRWVMKQRCQYTLRQKGEKNQLSDERVGRLEGIGFSWTAPSFRKKKEGGHDYPTAPPPPPPQPTTHHVPQAPAPLLPPTGHPNQALPPHDFRRWV